MNTKLTTAVEAYFADLRRVHASGGATGERSSYPALAGLLNAVGAALKDDLGIAEGLVYTAQATAFRLLLGTLTWYATIPPEMSC